MMGADPVQQGGGFAGQAGFGGPAGIAQHGEVRLGQGLQVDLAVVGGGQRLQGGALGHEEADDPGGAGVGLGDRGGHWNGCAGALQGHRGGHRQAAAGGVAAEDVGGEQAEAAVGGLPLAAGDADLGDDAGAVMAQFVGAIVDQGGVGRFLDGHGGRSGQGQQQGGEGGQAAHVRVSACSRF
jgi:hypothetical protein